MPFDERARVVAAIDDISKGGLDKSAVIFRQIEGKLWEIKVSSQRIFYVVLFGPEMILLHAYKKQGQKAPVKEIDTARKRLKVVLGG